MCVHQEKSQKFEKDKNVATELKNLENTENPHKVDYE